MCGIAGFLQLPSRSRDSSEAVLRAMANTLVHRGPDAEGTWLSPDGSAGLAHRRLSILDLSPEGSQPMVSASGRFVVAFNGEIYNHRELRGELGGTGTSFRGHSDTEVMLAAFERWGIAAATRRFTGMFAFAVWDEHQRTLTLGRDRLGEKPLYYGWAGSTLLFGSELKALRAHPDWRGGVDRGALASYLRHNYIPAPLSIHAGIRKLMPGTLATLRATMQAAAPGHEAIEPYWTVREAAVAGQNPPFAGTDAELDARLEELLRRSVGRQMVADVPLGAFLSGGIDSSTIVALMQAQSPRPVRTFTIGFDDHAFNEAAHARAVAAHLGTDHTELFVTGDEALGVVPRLAGIYDEPFGDSSAIPTVLLAALTRRHVTVSLSGDGADELFLGYSRYHEVAGKHRFLRNIPGPVRRGLGRTMQLTAGGTRGRFRKLGDLLAAQPLEAIYPALITLWKYPEQVVIGAEESPSLFRDPGAWPRIKDFRHMMMFLDQKVYLPDDILVKVDRASMAASLESRSPFLDHALVEFAWSLPPGRLMDAGGGKLPLRRILHRHVPSALVDRPKMGFGVPLASWLRGPLREWAGALLDEKRLEHEGYLNARRVHAGWQRFLAGRWQGGEHYLWNILMFQAWRERWHA